MTNKLTHLRATTAAALITAPGSGHGKSMITAALARLHRNAGRRVRVFKHGPDYLDPMVLELASGHPVYQLHPWMTGEAECRWRLAAAAEEADVILVEGSMGLFDGSPSSADLAVLAGIPAIPVIDARGMAQTFGAVALGLATYRKDIAVKEVIANRIGSARHEDMLETSLPEGISLLGAVPRSEAMAIPDRHLGLVQASELADLDAKLDAAASVLVSAGLDRLPAQVTFEAEAPALPPRLLEGWDIGVARDAAFAFIYPANLDLLKAMGARLHVFSPLTDTRLPKVNALWLPGGYPELHGSVLARNTGMLADIRAFHARGGAILAECGGLMYCAETLTDHSGQQHDLLGLIEGETRMADKLMALGLQSLKLEGEALRGHTYHHSVLNTTCVPLTHTFKLAGTQAEPVFHIGGLTASYFHGYFPSAPALVAAIFRGQPLQTEILTRGQSNA